MAENLEGAKKRIYDYLLSLGQRTGTQNAMRNAMMGVRPFAEALGEKSYKEARDTEQREFLSGEAEKSRTFQAEQAKLALDEQIREFNERLAKMSEESQWQRQQNLLPYTGPTEQMFSTAYGPDWNTRDLRDTSMFQRQLSRYSPFFDYPKKANTGLILQGTGGLMNYNQPSTGTGAKDWWEIQFPSQANWLRQQGGFI